jgi:hypothetical protein
MKYGRYFEITNRINETPGDCGAGAQSAGQQSYAPNGVMPVWLAIGMEPMTTEEPYEGNLHVRDCGGSAG